MLERNDRLVPETLSRGVILGVVLTGGASRRFGSNKALAELGGQSLIQRVAARARPQVAALAFSGSNPGGVIGPVIPDILPGEGPLTGILSALSWAHERNFQAIATFSCDAPFFPADMVNRLVEGMQPELACRFASSAGIRHPAFAVWRVSALSRVEKSYRTGERSLKKAQDHIGAEATNFPLGAAPQGDVFFNINQAEDLVVAEAWLRAAG